MWKRVLVLGTFDSKGAEFAFLREQIIANGCDVVTVNAGILGTSDEFTVDIEAEEVASAAGESLAELAAQRDRGRAVKVMSQGAAVLAKKLYEEDRIHGVIGMGGTGGTGIVTAAMRALPIGVPKLCVSTLASGNVADFVGEKDVVMMPSIVDVSGLNRISKLILARAAGAICGMVNAQMPKTSDERPLIAASMFGNTTKCVDACRKLLDEGGYETLVFHATGTGGRALESLAEDRLVEGVLDITTTEWADELCGGVLAAGPTRLEAAGKAGIPHLIVPGCIDMCNFGPMKSVPERYRNSGRQFYEWTPEITLMRTTPDENRQLGEIFASKANAARGPVAVLYPLRGVSMLDGDGERFCDREADLAFLNALKANLKPNIPVVEIDCNINDEAFAAKAAEMMLDLIQQAKR